MAKGWYGDKYAHGMASRGIRTNGIPKIRVRNSFKEWNERVDIELIKELYKNRYDEIERSAGVGREVLGADGGLEIVDGAEFGMYYIPDKNVFASVWHMDEGSDDDYDPDLGFFTSIVFLKYKRSSVDYGSLTIEEVYNPYGGTSSGHMYEFGDIQGTINKYYDGEVIGVW